MVYFTICIPTRNRQRYCIEALKAIAESEETDFEVIVADNSDDASVLDDYFRTRLNDDRFRLLPPGETVLSMVDNWERAVAEAQGRWISMIGDDDHLDPSVLQLIRRYEREQADLEVVSWARITFNWPDNRAIATLATVPVGHATLVPDRKTVSDQVFRWSDRGTRAIGGFGIYHGAVRRSLMERIKRKFSNRYFEHPTADLDNICKTVREAKAMKFCQRPFSVLGASVASNSASVRSLETTQKLGSEPGDGRQIQDDSFPFPPDRPGLAKISSYAAATWWFCRKYGVDNKGFQENFAHSAMQECLASRTVEEYTLKVEGLRQGFEAFEGGIWASHFDPPEQFLPATGQNELCGVHKGQMHVRESGLEKVTTPAEFYRFAESFLMPVRHVVSARQAFAA